ncbi:right-handed parallel beta-helix repeat-containing protein [Dyadobacter sp. CY345]|uniref:right-handed parallel beta-helix repeat-containing protein n=1 Tax=Dyadobacter sp. CY345 TaxID=2909335 RepID=UPI001F3E3931|nr:right-handed parallel beta-helix repeat-containing protein [Dyadobacter sp. CY345]MCF2446850.1 right-handed parallel beta-helix repeat-containing protein [Dyadobacter sp. CY345]
MKFFLNVLFVAIASYSFGQVNYIYVSLDGNDNNTGKVNKPVQSIKRALELSYSHAGKRVSIQLSGGTYYLQEAVEIVNSPDFPLEIEITASKGQEVFISAGRLLKTDWQHFKGGIYRTPVPSGSTFEQLFVNGNLQPLARYPNIDSTAKVFGGTAEDATYYVRVLTWGNPVGGYVHALDENKTGSLHYKITGVDDTDNLELEGGWQFKKLAHMSQKERYVENVFVELDEPGEWYLDKTAHVLYYYPTLGTDLSKSKFEVSHLKNSFIVKGSENKKLKNVHIKNLNYLHNERSFMDSKDTLTGSDRAVFRGGAVALEDTQDCSIENCSFSGLGGNAVVFNNFNERGTVTGCFISNIGSSGVSMLGNCKDCLIQDNLFSKMGTIEKQGVAVYMNGVKKSSIVQNTIIKTPGYGIKIENCNLAEIKVVQNESVKIFQEIRPMADDMTETTGDGHQESNSGVQKPRLKAFVPSLKVNHK